MENYYQLFDDSEDNNFCIVNDHETVSNEAAQIMGKADNALSISPIKLINTSLQSSVICGVLTGLLITLLWWIELNVRDYCTKDWDAIPNSFHRKELVLDSVEAIIVSLWPVLTIAPICQWSMIKESNILVWCAIAGLADALNRLSQYMLGYYDERWKSYVGNVIFLLISFVVFYKFAKYRQQLSNSTQNTILVNMKIFLQFIIGWLITLPYNYAFLEFYHRSPAFLRAILSCSLIAVFYVPKLIISNVLTNIHGLFLPSEIIVFASAFLVITTMVTRLTQAGIESLPYFTITSLAHGFFNVFEKLVLPIRRKILNLICRRSSDVADETWLYTQQYIVHQSLISIVTETSSVVMSNAAAYLMVYYYKKRESTGKWYDGWYLFKELFIRLSIAVSIECIVNIAALYIQEVRCNTPVLRVWKCKRKSIIVIHVIQSVFFVAYYSHYVNATLLGDFFQNSTQTCVGSFKRI